MEKSLVEERLVELSKDLANASIILNEQKDSVKALQIKVRRMEGAQMVLKEILDEVEKLEKLTF
ncbi:hypothetical protein LCGC14_1123960 [marine sediment metagenome]|uniref:Uncharacterized protein n=1 Tax=marine sediment metagenome TaxID=412755 RepID=A0A0F9M7X7_9ZZZZ